MTYKLSDDISHKLYAALYYEWPSSDGFFLTEYREALERWYAVLSKSEREAAAAARAAFDRGEETEAQKVTAALPPAPVCPADLVGQGGGQGGECGQTPAIPGYLGGDL